MLLIENISCVRLNRFIIFLDYSGGLLSLSVPSTPPLPVYGCSMQESRCRYSETLVLDIFNI